LVILSFTEDSVSKILAGRKCGTTRLPSTQWKWVVRHLEEGREVAAHIYNGNPRAGGELICKGKFLEGFLRRGREFEPDMILKDGFDSEKELAVRLWGHYGKGKADSQSALEWFQASLWSWFEFELPPAIEIREGMLVEVPLNSA
jgi:hypothetical protein